jgi:hypothetical protein
MKKGNVFDCLLGRGISRGIKVNWLASNCQNWVINGISGKVDGKNLYIYKKACDNLTLPNKILWQSAKCGHISVNILNSVYLKLLEL